MKAYVFVNVAAGKAADVLQPLRRIEGVKSADICWGCRTSSFRWKRRTRSPCRISCSTRFRRRAA